MHWEPPLNSGRTELVPARPWGEFTYDCGIDKEGPGLKLRLHPRSRASGQPPTHSLSRRPLSLQGTRPHGERKKPCSVPQSRDLDSMRSLWGGGRGGLGIQTPPLSSALL